MYIISTLGFYSIVRIDSNQDDEPTFAIRARARQDLATLLAAVPLDLSLHHTPERDYSWRVFANADQLRRLLLALAESIGAGGDLKSHPSRGDLYGTVWAVLAGIHDVQ